LTPCVAIPSKQLFAAGSPWRRGCGGAGSGEENIFCPSPDLAYRP
jgi:hypothetical protein